MKNVLASRPKGVGERAQEERDSSARTGGAEGEPRAGHQGVLHDAARVRGDEEERKAGEGKRCYAKVVISVLETAKQVVIPVFFL